jgi:hypothetical protein
LPKDGWTPDGRTPLSAHTRASLSIAKLCAVVWAVQIDSSAQYGDGCVGWPGLGVCASRTFSGIFDAVLVRGSTTGM